MRKTLLLVFSHGLFALAGFVAGIYTLPILTAPDAPTAVEVAATSENAEYRGEFRRDLAGSDRFHWGEGTVSISPQAVTLSGAISPGPDYRLYLAPEFVEDEAGFLEIKERAFEVGDVKTFENFIVAVPEGTELDRYDTVVVWCESFGEFITSARFR